MRFFLLGLAVILTAAGCDSASDSIRLDADSYVGAWTVVGLSDQAGDRSAVLDAALDDLSLTFRADRSFRLDADFNDAASAAGAEDFSASGTYLAQPDLPALVLTVQGIAATLRASAETPDRVRLTAPAAAVNVLLQGLPVPFEGDTSIVIERR